MLLTDLPPETIFHILGYLPIRSLLTVRQVCWHLNTITHDRSIWANALSTYVLRLNLPLPGLKSRQLSSLDSAEIEKLVIRALDLRRNWSSPFPRLRRLHHLENLDFYPINPAPIHNPDFLPGKRSRWLLSKSQYIRHGRGDLNQPVVTCWDTYVDPPACVANIQYEPGGWSMLIVNSDPSHEAAFVTIYSSLQSVEPSRTATVYSINDDAPLGANPIGRLSEYPCAEFARGLHGSMLFLEGRTPDVAHGFSVVQVVDVTTGSSMFHLRIACEPVTGHSDRLKVFLPIMVYREKYIVLFRRKHILMFVLPPEIFDGSVRLANKGIFLDPVDEYSWRFNIDSAVATFHSSNLSRHICNSFQNRPSTPQYFEVPPSPITLLVRFDSYYPWPVNLLHQFTLRPNLSFDPTVPVGRDISSGKSTNLPYILQPIQITNIASPMRMFTPSDMTLGPYGTAIWIDAQTDPDPTQAGDYGQRLAGRTLSPSILTNDVAPRDSTFDTSRAPSPMGEVVAAFVEPNRDGDVPASQDGEGPGVEGTQVFDISDDNLWVRVAVDEQEGRIAAGRVDGTVALYEYARE